MKSTNHTDRQGYRVCERCQYEWTEATADRCEACGATFPAGQTTIIYPDMQTRSRGLRWLLPFAPLLLLAALVWWWWRPATKLPPIAHLSTFSPSSPQTNQPRYSTIADVPAPLGNFDYSGALPFAPLRTQGFNDRIAQTHPGFKITYRDTPTTNPGSGTGIEQLINSSLSFAQSVRPLNDAEVAKAKDRGLRLEPIPIGIDGLIFYTHPDLLMPGLSLDQVKGIFQGEITNWREVGGPDLEIVPFGFSPQATGTLKVMLGIENDELAPNLKIIRDYTTGVRQVALTPGGISYGSAASIASQKMVQPLGLARAGAKDFVFPLADDGKVNTKAFQDGSYPLTRRLFVLVRKDDTLDGQAGMAYANMLLSREGQKFLSDAGFVPLQAAP